MGYAIKLEGFEGQDIEGRTSIWTGPKLFVNGSPAEKGKGFGEMLLTRNDGRQVAARWVQQMLGLDVPKLDVDGHVVELVKPLQWYQWIWGGLPGLLIFVGGLLGGMFGILGFTINSKIFRSSMQPILQYVVTAGVTILTAIAYFIAAILFSLILNSL